MSFQISEIQSLIKAHGANALANEAAARALKITGMKELKSAGPNDVAFFFSKNYQDDLFQTKAGLIITGTVFVKPLEAAHLPQWKTSVFLACDDPYVAMAIVSGKFSEVKSSHDHQNFYSETSIHPSSVIDPSVKLGKKVKVYPSVVIEAGAVISDGVVIYPHCYVGPFCEIGAGSVLFPNVTLYEKTIIGKSCRIHAGAVIGADGFGYAPLTEVQGDKKNTVDHQKIYHLGRVVMGDFVEIGANTTIDRGTMGDTMIHSKVKIDNQVQVAHNCEVGEGSIICGNSAMAGSSSLGKFVILAGQSGTNNQVHVGDYAKIGAFSGVGRDLEPYAEVMGVPARDMREFYKIAALQSKLLKDRKKN